MTYSFIIMFLKVRTRSGALDKRAHVGCQPSRQVSSTERVGSKHAAIQYLHQVSIQFL